MRVAPILHSVYLMCALHAQTHSIPKANRPVAIVCQLEGKVQASRPEGGRRLLLKHDWLREGGSVYTGESGRVVLVFTGGDRFALEKNSSAILAPKGFTMIKGVIHRQDPVPMIPSMSDISLQEAMGNPGGIIVRGESSPSSWFSNLQPDGGAALAHEVTLSFSAKDPKGPFTVVIQDASGAVVLSRDGVSGSIKIGPTVLQPGMSYTWDVITTGGPKSNSATASFRTVPEKFVGIRNQLRAELDQKKDPDLKSLLEAMDRWLGLTD